MIVVVGGQVRKVGKTRAMCDIIKATRELGWTAVKLTPHQHEPPAAGHLTDTDRFLAAGAAHTLLTHSAADVPRTGNVIIESNSILDHIEPELFVFVVDPENPQWKPSARRLFSRADIVVEREISPALLGQITSRVRPLIAG